MKHLVTATLAAIAALGVAHAQDSKGAAGAKGAADCTPAPKGLVIRELAPGTGEKTVMFRSGVYAAYTGWLYDPCAKDFKGEKFDTSEGRGTPFGFLVGTGRVIKGWDQGVLGMKEGGKRLLIIPPDLAYGAAGAGGGKIPPNAPLVFEVEIVGIPFEPSQTTPQEAPKK